MPQKMDPRIESNLRANPNMTPSEVTQMVYGKKTKDIELKPDLTIRQRLMRLLLGQDNAVAAETFMADGKTPVKK